MPERSRQQEARLLVRSWLRLGLVLAVLVLFVMFDADFGWGEKVAALAVAILAMAAALLFMVVDEMNRLG